MGDTDAALKGPDLTAGVPITEVSEGGMLAGHANGEPVLLARQAGEWFALGALCSHYSGPLAEGLLVGDTVRCPWHHACFSLRTGQSLRPPGLNAVPRWRVEQRGDSVFVTGKEPDQAPGLHYARSGKRGPTSVVIVGAGAAGERAAETLRREGYAGPVTVYDPDPA